MNNSLFDPPAIVRPAADLRALISQAKSAHAAASACDSQKLEQWRLAGETIKRIRDRCGSRKFAPILRQCGIPRRTAYRYMELADMWDDAKCATVAQIGLGLCDAILFLKGEYERDDDIRCTDKELGELATQAADCETMAPEDQEAIDRYGLAHGILPYTKTEELNAEFQEWADRQKALIDRPDVTLAELVEIQNASMKWQNMWARQRISAERQVGRMLEELRNEDATGGIQ
jgi:hypothetical protein